MLKKIIIFFLILTTILSAFDFALADSPDYSVTPSVTVVNYGESVTFDISAPSSVAKIKVYADGAYKCSAAPVSDGQNKWTAAVTFKKLGSVKISFKAYSASGKLITAFPGKPVVITVKHLPPVTETPVILDCDRAVLLGTPPAYCGTKLRKYGFYFGTDPKSLNSNIKSNGLIRTEMNKLVTGLSPETTYYYKAYVVTSKGTFTGDVVSFTTPAKTEWTADNIMFSDITDKYKFMFGTDTRFYKWGNPPYGFANVAEAEKQMVTINVPVWKLVKNRKVSGTMSLTVNYKLGNSVKAVFQDIYNLDIKFPIVSLKGFWYRKATGPGVTGKGILSHHSYGAAIDVNKLYNPFILTDTRDTTSPYYIPQAVIDIFVKYGWSWGGNFKEGMDTMHFQYLGLDLLGN